VIARSVRIAGATSAGTSVVALIAFNLIPLVGVLFGRWTVATLLVLYWVENGIVGILNVPKILLAEGPVTTGTSDPLGRAVRSNRISPAMRIPIAGFFLIHYGIFWLVHGVFVWTLPMFLAPRPELGPDGFPGLGATSLPAVAAAASVDGSAVFWGAIGLAVSHGLSFVVNDLGRGEYRKVSAAQQAGRPYGRLVILHMAILLGAIVSLTIGSPIGALLVLVVLKTAIDLALHRREHARLSGAPAPAMPV
jgi:hypothetical protein